MQGLGCLHTPPPGISMTTPETGTIFTHNLPHIGADPRLSESTSTLPGSQQFTAGEGFGPRPG